MCADKKILKSFGKGVRKRKIFRKKEKIKSEERARAAERGNILYSPTRKGTESGAEEAEKDGEKRAKIFNFWYLRSKKRKNEVI